MRKRIVFSLIGGVGGMLSLAFRSTATAYFGGQPTHIAYLAIDVLTFTILALFILGSILLSSSRTKANSGFIAAAGSVLVGVLAGPVFPWGTIGYVLSFLIAAAVLPITLHRLSKRALKGMLFSFFGFLLGWAVSTLWIIAIWRFGPALLTSEPWTGWLPLGIVCYAFTLGLHLSVERNGTVIV
ncbi:MAG: hypothetical protein ACREBU_26675 [Nitrososphaera sp.]